ncbi:two-component sensor histidine kinase [Streptomyces spongiicola]|uniref:histidine kinase n=1 Tax=Streptomyces spongiicola TaxID=1690221 RepID=A0ABM6VA00_9ACTN|nr:histidine kinase [Streptomyces spongiicola]AWK10800.1 two-component sensor histidine kinase [Streptomyces spongiicola]
MTFPRPHRDDVLIAVTGLAGGLLLWALGLHTTEGVRPLSGPWPVLVPLLAMSGLELLRRTMPRTALLAGTAAIAADQFTPGSIATVLMFTDLVYAAVVYGPPASARRIPYAAGLITAGVTVCSLAWFQDPSALLLGLVVGLVTVVPAATGALVRNHREAAEAARLRAEQTALLAELDRREAITAERARMARELHDLVANHLSAIAIHSTAALSLDEPATTRRALTVIRENSVEGLAEMRRLIGLLRDSGGSDSGCDGEPAVAPTLAGLDALVDQAATSGAASGLKCTLDDAIDADAAPPAPVALAAYRIVQESLTNALKHADAGEVAVRLTGAAGRALTVTVTSPYGGGPEPRAPGSGAGLVGMRERIALLGGEFEAGPGPGPAGGPARVWRVRAVLPTVDGKEPSA